MKNKVDDIRLICNNQTSSQVRDHNTENWSAGFDLHDPTGKSTRSNFVGAPKRRDDSLF
jgi:hypothetical protein